MNTKKKKIAILGPYPPPYGGISVHIQRAIALLASMHVPFDYYAENLPTKINSSFYPFFKSNRCWALLRLYFTPYRLIHHHSPDLSTRLILLFFGFLGKRVYLHIHGASLEDTVNSNGIKSIVFKRMLKYAHVLADNTRIASIAEKYHPKSVSVIDAFIPPLYDEQVFSEFNNTFSFLFSGNSHHVIFMVGWFSLYKGQDLYGFDCAIEAITKLKTIIGNDIILICSINGIQDTVLHESMVVSIKNNNLEKNIYLLFDNPEEIWPLYLKSDVFIRPTCSDGSALSVKEALWCGLPVIASDCVPRPEEVILFKNRSSDDLCAKLVDVLSNKLPARTTRATHFKEKRFSGDLFTNIYKVENITNEPER